MYGIEKYKEINTEIEAVEFNGWNEGIILDWVNNKSGLYPACYKETMQIGETIVDIGDFIIKNKEGKISFCNPEIFKKKYEKILEK